MCDPRPGRRSACAAPFVLLATVVAAATLLAGCGDDPAQPRRQQMVKLLPDTPPPPPPPPKPEDKPPPPKPEDKPRPAEAPKAQEQPAAQALKSDEEAGSGPGSGLAAGAVTQDYSGQALNAGQVIGGGPPVADALAARLAAQTYAQSATQAINAFLAREQEIKRQGYQLRVDVWLAADGALQRAELVGSSGDAGLDQALREALRRFPGAGAPPPRLPQPLRLMVTNRMMG